MRYFVAGLLALHGLLHILGVQWGKAAGSLWGAAWLVLLVAALMRLRDHPLWWMVAGVGLLLSQGLIISAWSSARAGTLLNLVLAAPVIVAAGQHLFHQRSDRLTSELLREAPAAGALVTSEEVAPLPPPVRRWLESAGVVGRPRVRTVALEQQGQLRTAPDGPWLPARAHQWFTVDRPGFLWTVDLTMKGVPVVGRDSYRDGRGRMLIAGAGLVKIVDGRGPKIDQGSLLRYLGEIIWFPSAALAPYLRWEPIDAGSARVIMSYGGATGSAVFTFDQQGRMREMTADRYMGSGPGATLERW
jgi:hypothetical protein